MNYAIVAIGWCLLAQAPGSSGVEPIRPARPAPPAQLGDVPTESAVPGDQAPAADVWQDPPAADGSREVPDRYHQTDNEPAGPDETAGRDERPGKEDAPGRMEPLGSAPRQKLRPPELIAEALENPRQEALVGTPLSLSQALERTGDRQQQLKIAGSYWELATAQAEYHWALKQRDVLADHLGAHANLAGGLAAQAAADADVRDAQLSVEAAQLKLAELLGFGGEAQLPLASDRPHVGDYRTHYENLFSGRVPPARIRLIHRTLPLRRKAIDAHGEAIVAAVDAVDAAGRQFRDSGQGLSTLLEAIQLLGHQRWAFIAEVRDYNLDIAEYAFVVAPAGAGGDTLVSMLIRTTPPAGNVPTRATEGNSDPSIHKTFRQGPGGQGAATADQDDWTVNYRGELEGAADDPAVYQGLLDVANHPLRVQKLGNLLHWDRNLPSDSGEPAALGDCLRQVPPQDRLAVIGAYWRARQCAAQFQATLEEQEQLTALQSIAIPLRDQPGMAEAAVRLQAARRAARAAALDAQLKLLTAQYELTLAAGRPLDGLWLLPTTPPQSGRYQVAAGGRRGSQHSARWADMTALEYEKVQHRADAVIQCDAHRADLVLRARRNETGPDASDDQMTPLDRVVWATRRQHQQTLAFLDDLTDYNLAIANYVLNLLPATLSGDELAGKLAIVRNTLRDS